MAAPRLLPLYALLLLLAGCATRTGEPMNMGQGVYMMSGSTLSLTANTHDVVTDIQRHASSFCASSGGRTLEVVRVDTPSEKPIGFPEGRLQFRCVEQAQEMASASAGSKVAATAP